MKLPPLSAEITGPAAAIPGTAPTSVHVIPPPGYPAIPDPATASGGAPAARHSAARRCARRRCIGSRRIASVRSARGRRRGLAQRRVGREVRHVHAVGPGETRRRETRRGPADVEHGLQHPRPSARRDQAGHSTARPTGRHGNLLAAASAGEAVHGRAGRNARPDRAEMQRALGVAGADQRHPRPAEPHARPATEGRPRAVRGDDQPGARAK